MTRIDYPDLVRISPDGKLRLEIRSPDNAPFPRAPVNASQACWGGFQCDFTYTVTHIESGDVVWQGTPDDDDLLSAPNDAWVSNTGQVIVVTRPPFGSGLFVLNSAGKTIRKFDVASEVLNDNSREMHETSAGSHWNERGHGLFFAVAGQSFWVFRTELNRQVVVELETGNLLAENEAIRRERRRVQRKWALAIVRKHSENLQLYGEPFAKRNWRMLRRLRTAILWCGLDRIRRSLSELRRFEHSTVAQSYTSGWKLSDGQRSNLVHLLLVGVTQFALRRMGEEPAGVAPFWLCRDRGNFPKARTRVPVPERIQDRAARLQELKPGMTPLQVVKLVGMPDIEGHSWQYDILDSEAGPCTIAITWHARRDTITKIERLPPGWIKWRSRVSWM